MTDKIQLLNDMKAAVLEGEIDNGIQLSNQALEAGADPLDCIENGFVVGINEVGRRYESGEMFLPELIAAAEVMKAALTILEPELKKKQQVRAVLGRVVIGSVQHDIHDIGKDIVASMLTAAGFEVVNLGVDVPGETFIANVKEFKPDLVGMSALLTTTMPEQKKVIQLLVQEGLRDKVKVMVGGAPVNREWAELINADGFAENAVSAVKMARSLVGR